MSVHAVHAGAERNVCNIVISTEKTQTTINPSQTLLPVHKLAHLPLPHSKPSPPRPPQPLAQLFAQMHYRCKYQVSSTGPNILEVYIIYLHGDMCQYMRFCHLSHVPRLRFACALLKFYQNFHLLTHKYMEINDIHFKYILAGRRYLILSSVVHLRKRLS